MGSAHFYSVRKWYEVGKSGINWQGKPTTGGNADVFRGANAISLDAKGRLAMPSRYRDELVSRCNGQLIVTIDAVDPCLTVYPLPEWEIIEAKLRELPSLREETRRLQRLLIGNAVDLELDGNGRFLVPPRLREYAKLDKRAMLVGQLNKFQLWDEDKWNAVAEADLAAIKEPGGLPDELRDLIL